jgi:hypothetical protein
MGGLFICIEPLGKFLTVLKSVINCYKELHGLEMG